MRITWEDDDVHRGLQIKQRKGNDIASMIFQDSDGLWSVGCDNGLVLIKAVYTKELVRFLNHKDFIPVHIEHVINRGKINNCTVVGRNPDVVVNLDELPK